MSSETPPSYNQLNYNDNLSRFFNSQPKTLSEKEVNAIEDQGEQQQGRGEQPMQTQSQGEPQQQQQQQLANKPMQEVVW